METSVPLHAERCPQCTDAFCLIPMSGVHLTELILDLCLHLKKSTPVFLAKYVIEAPG